MDTSRFDRLAMTFGQDPSRRDLLRLIGAAALAVGGLTLLESDDSDAKKRRKNKKKSSCKGKCGGKCPRCSAGKSCDDRNDCTTALCKDGICAEPVDQADCGLDTNGDTCFTRDTTDGVKYCSRQVCRFFATGTCNQCTSEENCSNAGDDIECCLPCGSPLA